jgi:hypothetical protein
VAKVGPHLAPRLAGSTGNATDDALARADLAALVRAAAVPNCPETFDERVAFRGADAPLRREQLRTRFYNISRILDCVGCEKCRLWGKVQVMGLGTALKVLFTSGSAIPDSGPDSQTGGDDHDRPAVCGEDAAGIDAQVSTARDAQFARIAASLSRTEVIAFSTCLFVVFLKKKIEFF